MEEAERSEVIPLERGAVAVFCARCPGKETPNEDGAVVIPVDARRTILAVADGMGGQPAGDEASGIALDALTRSISAAMNGSAAPPAGSLRPAILNGFEAANRLLLDAATGAGTTLAVAEIDGRTMRPYHVGDSVILVGGQRGKLKLETVAHSPVGYAVEAGWLDAADAMHHQDRHLVSNFVGTPDMRIEVGPTITLRPRDTVVLGSDGLFDNLHADEVLAIVRKGALATVADTLAEAVRARMLAPEPDHPSKPDDVTFILYRPSPDTA
jgi:serine/threonine protein phosphatase PrpC